MSRVDSPIASSQPALEALLRCWPVLCQVEGEWVVDATRKSLDFPALVLVTRGPIWMEPGRQQLEAGDILVAHEPDAATLAVASPDDLDRTLTTSWEAADPVESPAMVVVRLHSMGTQFSPGLMPKPFVSSSIGAADRALQSALQEAVRSRLAGPVANAVATAVYLQCIREHLQSRPREVQMLAGLFDSEIGPVVAALLQAPAEEWTVESLADVGGMSRSAFARKFRDLMGAAPIDFLVEVRMWQAARLLRQPARDLKSIAREAGYQSPAAFSVAFKRWSGAAPSEYRRQA